MVQLRAICDPGQPDRPVCVYFLAAVLAGRQGLGEFSAMLQAASVWRWPLSAGSLYLGFAALQIVKLSGRFAPSALAWSGLYGAYLVLFCAAATIGWLAVMLRFVRRPATIWSSLAANAYGI